MNSNVQLVLGLGPQQDCRFDNFYVGRNQALLFFLKQFIFSKTDHFVYIAGMAGVGKSHLLQACCHAASEAGLQTMYLPLEDLVNYDPAVLENLEEHALLCLDDIQVLQAYPHWQEAVFHLYNRVKQKEHQLIVAGDRPVRDLPLSLPDLLSRLAWGPAYQLFDLEDEEKLQCLAERARLSGLSFPDEVGRYLLTRYSRDINRLCAALEKLDTASLVEKKRLTIPFVKRILEI